MFSCYHRTGITLKHFVNGTLLEIHRTQQIRLDSHLWQLQRRINYARNTLAGNILNQVPYSTQHWNTKWRWLTSFNISENVELSRKVGILNWSLCVRMGGGGGSEGGGGGGGGGATGGRGGDGPRCTSLSQPESSRWEVKGDRGRGCSAADDTSLRDSSPPVI